LTPRKIICHRTVREPAFASPSSGKDSDVALDVRRRVFLRGELAEHAAAGAAGSHLIEL
jgi:hypothetical protein